MSKESWISSDLKNRCQVRLHRQTDTSYQVSVISDRQPKAMKKWHRIFSFDFSNHLLTSCKELIWFYTAKIDGHTPARPCPWALQSCKFVSSSHQALAFPGEHLWAVQRRQSHRSNFPPSVLMPPPLSKMRQKTQALLCLLLVAQGPFSHRGRGGVPWLLLSPLWKRTVRRSWPVHTEPSLVAFVIFCSGKTSLSGFTKV